MLPTIRTEREADVALDEARLHWIGADDVWEAITWVISHDPTVGTALSESGHVRSYTIHGAVSVGWPTLTIIYTIDDGTLTITDANFQDAKAFPAGHA